MLRSLLQSLETLLGPSLAGVSRVVHITGALVLVAAALLPLWRLWLDYTAAGAGLVRRWVMTCGHCGETGLPNEQGACARCGTALPAPWLVRRRTRAPEWLERPGTRRLVLGYHAAGALAFLALAAWVVASGGLAAPRGALARLFAGVALLALAAAGRGIARALRAERRGVLARGGDALSAGAAVGVLAVSLLLTGAARLPEETSVTRFMVSADGARVGERLVAPRGGEIGVEYLQVDCASLGVSRIVPLAVVGQQRAPLPLGGPARWAVEHLRAHADGYEARGLVVRVRHEWRRVSAGATYEVVEKDGQLLLRRAAAGPDRAR